MIQNESATISKAEIYVNEMIFYSKEDISLLGFISDQNRFHETEMVIGRVELQTLLSQNGRKGVELLWKIEDLFVAPHRVPAGINLVELYGTTQVLQAKEIRLAPSWKENEEQELVPCQDLGLLFVEEVKTASATKKLFSNQ